MRGLFTAILSIAAMVSSAQIDTYLKEAEGILTGNTNRPKVMVLGVFHFAYYNLDAHVTESDDQVDVLSPKRQKEMEELVAYIQQFKPNKIAVESGSNTGYLMHRYDEWVSGTRTMSRDETEQIGFRLMQLNNLDTIYGVNAGTLEYDLYFLPDSMVLRPILDSIYRDWDFNSDDSISLRYDKYYNYMDSVASEITLLEYLQLMNDPLILDRGFGSYLSGDFELGSYDGADALAMHWYSRNLRIMRNIQNITTSQDDRILVIIGAGHAQILTHLFACSPGYQLVRIEELDNK